jgi:hypothetical protein
MTTIIEEVKHDGASGDDEEGHSLQVVVVSVQYNGGSVINAPSNIKKFEWSINKKDGSLRALQQTMVVRDGKTTTPVTADFDAQKNQTTITTGTKTNSEQEGEHGGDDGNDKVTRVTKAGLVLLMLGTNSGKLMISY